MFYRIAEITPAKPTLADPVDPLRLALLTAGNGQPTTAEQTLVVLQEPLPIVLPTSVEIGLIPIGLTKQLAL